MRRADRVLSALAVVIAGAAAAFGFVSVARNRLLSGQPVGLVDMAAGWPLWLGLVGFGALLVGALAGRRWACLLGAVALSAALTWMAGDHAAAVALRQPAARVSFGAAFWLMQAGCLLVLIEAARQLGHRAAGLAFGLMAAPLVMLLLTDQLSALSLLREYANRQGVLEAAFLRHIEIVVAAVIPTLLIGLPLGLACHRRPGLGRVMFPSLGLIQTIPSIALFALLLAPLSGLASLFPVLGRAGISGIGLAPAVIALVLYSLLPITRNTTAGLDGVPAPVRDAAAGLGMTRSQIFWQVDARLAFPTLLAGLRITLVQAIGLAAVAALIGAGGLGAIMFDGLFAGAIDVVLLGAIPLIALAVAADLLLRMAVR